MSWGVGVVQEEIYKGSGYRSGKPNRDLYYILPHKVTVCPGSSDSFYIASLLYKMGHYFLDILYVGQPEDSNELGVQEI